MARPGGSEIGRSKGHFTCTDAGGKKGKDKGKGKGKRWRGKIIWTSHLYHFASIWGCGMLNHVETLFFQSQDRVAVLMLFDAFCSSGPLSLKALRMKSKKLVRHYTHVKINWSETWRAFHAFPHRPIHHFISFPCFLFPCWSMLHLQSMLRWRPRDPSCLGLQVYQWTSTPVQCATLLG